MTTPPTPNTHQPAAASEGPTSFHLDPQTADAGVCVTPEACEFGIEACAHRDTVEAIYALMETIYAEFVIPVPAKRTGPVAPDRLAAILAWRNPSVWSTRPSR